MMLILMNYICCNVRARRFEAFLFMNSEQVTLDFTTNGGKEGIFYGYYNLRSTIKNEAYHHYQAHSIGRQFTGGVLVDLDKLTSFKNSIENKAFHFQIHKTPTFDKTTDEYKVQTLENYTRTLSGTYAK